MPSPKQRKDATRHAAGIVRPLAADDPRDLNHPCHREQFLELARAIGRSMARKQYEEDHPKDHTDETNPKDRSNLF
jgi:hypothetical protein